MIDVLRQAVMIAGFVFVMMLVIEYVNVLTSGTWRNRLAKSLLGQYLLAAALGAVPGCLGAFAVVAMYSHHLLGIGALVAAMIATSGDESFVMFAMFPGRALLITGILFVLGVAGGAITDVVIGKRWSTESLRCEGLEYHAEYNCSCYPRGEILRQWRECSAARGILAVLLVVIIVAIALGQIGPGEWNWVRVTLILVSSIALFIVSTVNEHFLEEHLWRHIARKHLPQVFLWTLGVLLVMYLLTEHQQLDLSDATGRGKWILLLFACLLGIVPQSGPHLVFVTLYAKGAIPLGILIASSIVQDGHGMLPLLAHSRRAFIVIKAVNFLFGFLVGAIALAAGF